MTVPYFIQTPKELPPEVKCCQLTPQAGGGFIVDAWACADGTRGSHRPERMLRPAPADPTDPVDPADISDRKDARHDDLPDPALAA